MCEVRSSAIVNGPSASALTSIVPVNGRVNTNAVVVVPISRLDDPAGKTATYTCRLFARKLAPGDANNKIELREGTETDWVLFSAGASDSAFRLSPDPAAITGSFLWADPAPTAAAPPNVTTTSPGGNP